MTYGGVGKKLKVLFYDFGLAVEHALRMADDGHEVRYFSPWGGAFPKFKDYAPGLGYEERGMKKVLYFWENVDWADLIVFPDIGAGDMAQYLRDSGKIVFGGAKAEKLENDRQLMRKFQEESGLPMQKTEQVTGISALREYLKNHPNKYVKLNIFRGDVESFYAESYERIKLYLDEIGVALGPFAETYKFMVEDFIEGIEPGFDCYFTNGDWVKPYLWGIEQSKSSYLGKYVDEMPKPIQEVADKLRPLLAKMDYRGTFSTEVRVTKDGTPYLIDVCLRYAYPLSASYALSVKNYSEVIWKVARGETVRIENAAKYMGATPLTASHADTHYIRLEIDDKYKKYIKTRVSAQLRGIPYSIPGMNVVAVLSAVGDDYNKVIKAMEGLADHVNAYTLDKDGLSTMYKIGDIIKEYEDFGMGKF